MTVPASLLAALVLWAAPLPAHDPGTKLRLRLDEYLRGVMAANPTLQAARLAVEVAAAQIEVAKTFPDPALTLALGQFDASRAGNPTMAGAQVALPIELGGKRRARIEAARSAWAASGAVHADTARVLRGTAASLFVEALHARLVAEHKRRALGHLERLVEVNRNRLRAGDIGESELLQSRVEAGQFAAELAEAEGARAVAEAGLAALLGPLGPASVEPVGDLDGAFAAPEPAHCEQALEQRADLRAAHLHVEQAEREVQVEVSKRTPDIAVGAAWTHAFPQDSRSAELLSASLTVPLPFSYVYRGALSAAHAAHRQAQSELEGMRAQARAELRQALARVVAAERRTTIYRQGTLADSSTVLANVIYSYQHGEASLIEVLIAQRTASDVEMAYLDALADRAQALIAVAQATGMTDALPGL